MIPLLIIAVVFTIFFAVMALSMGATSARADRRAAMFDQDTSDDDHPYIDHDLPVRIFGADRADGRQS